MPTYRQGCRFRFAVVSGRDVGGGCETLFQHRLEREAYTLCSGRGDECSSESPDGDGMTVGLGHGGLRVVRGHFDGGNADDE